jgi:hypothetical protein
MRLKKEVRRLGKEKSRAVLDEESSKFVVLHELCRKDLESKRDKVVALQQRVVNERELLLSLGSLLDAKESHLLQYVLTDPPFVAKVCLSSFFKKKNFFLKKRTTSGFHLLHALCCTNAVASWWPWTFG